MRHIGILRSALDKVMKVTAPGIIASGSLSLQILLASMALLSTELWRIHGKLQ